MARKPSKKQIEIDENERKRMANTESARRCKLEKQAEMQENMRICQLTVPEFEPVPRKPPQPGSVLWHHNLWRRRKGGSSSTK